MKLRPCILLLGSLMAASAASLIAQPHENPFEVSPFVGHLFGGTVFDLRSPVDSDLSFDLRLADHPSYGLRLGYLFGNGFEPELEWSGVDTPLEFANLFGPTRNRAQIDFFLAGLTYNFLTEPVRPYANLSVGAARLSGGGETDVLFTGKLAVGLKAFLTPWLGLRVEAGGYATRLGNSAFGITCTTFIIRDGVAVPVPCEKSWLLNGDVGGGLIFAF